MPHDTRDTIVDFVRAWSERTEIPAARFISWIGVARGKFYDWQKRYGKANEHNALVPRDHWIEEWEREAILAFHERYSLEGYRRLAFMMLDANVVAVSPPPSGACSARPASSTGGTRARRRRAPASSSR